MDQPREMSPPEVPPPETTVVDSARVWCDGSGQIRGGANYRPAALGHPRVWLQIDDSGYADCGYCDRRFVLRGGPADESESGADRA
ncbi:MAG: zinc-finger domain-containing protein [Croceibacterium sp.]